MKLGSRGLSRVQVRSIFKVTRRLYRWLLRFLVAGVLALGLSFLPYEIYGPHGLKRALRLDSELRSMLDQNSKLARENTLLRKHVKRLQDDPRLIEQVARDDLGYAGPNDIVFQFE